MAEKERSFPRIYVRNDLDIDCQIIRNENEMKIFKNQGKFRCCLIEDYDNFGYWEKGEPPYNDENMSFGIQKNLFEVFTGRNIKDFSSTK